MRDLTRFDSYEIGVPQGGLMAVPDPVNFTQRQIAWLEQQYPEQIATPTRTEAEIRFHAGQRSVIHAIRARKQKEV